MNLIRVATAGFLSSLLFSACEQAVIPGEFQFVEKLVVKGILEAGKPVNELYVGRTQPMTEATTREGNAVTDAVVRIESASGQVVLPFRGVVFDTIGDYTRYGLYGSDSLIVSPGERYRLIVEWRDLIAYSETIVPFPVVIDTLTIDTVQSYSVFYKVESIFGGMTETVYTGYLDISPRYVFLESNEFVLITSNSPVNLRTIESFPYAFITDSAEYVILALDPKYLDYYLTRDNHQAGGGGIFGALGGKVRWNVHGDGLGLFIGRAETRKTVALPPL